MFSCRAVCLCDMAWPTKGGLDLSSFQCKWHPQTSSFPSEQLVGSNLNEQIVSAHSCTEISGNAPFRWKSTEKGPGRQRNFPLTKGKSVAPSKLSIIQRRVTYKEGFRHWHFKDQQFVGFKGSMQFISGAKQRLRVPWALSAYGPCIFGSLSPADPICSVILALNVCYVPGTKTKNNKLHKMNFSSCTTLSGVLGSLDNCSALDSAPLGITYPPPNVNSRCNKISNKIRLPTDSLQT